MLASSVQARYVPADEMLHIALISSRGRRKSFHDRGGGQAAWTRCFKWMIHTSAT